MALPGALPARRTSSAGAALRNATTTALRRAGAALKTTGNRLSGSVLTIAGLGCIDVGAFEAHPIAGWVTTGLSVLLLDWKLE